MELDLVAPDPDDPKGLLVAEVKWRQLSAAERDAVRRDLESRWAGCSLRARTPGSGSCRGLCGEAAGAVP